MGTSINLPVSGIPAVLTAASLPVSGSSGQAYIAADTGIIYGWSVTNSAWEAAGSSPPGGSNTQIQYNNSGSFAGSANLTWDNAHHYLGIGRALTGTAVLEVYASTAPTGGLIASFETQTENIYSIFKSGTASFLIGCNTNSVGFFGMLSNHAFGVRTNNEDRWTWDTSGNMLCATDGGGDIGASGANRPNNIHLKGVIDMGGLTNTAIHALTATEGMFAYDTTNHVLCFYDGSVWQQVTYSALP